MVLILQDITALWIATSLKVSSLNSKKLTILTQDLKD